MDFNNDNGGGYKQSPSLQSKIDFDALKKARNQKLQLKKRLKILDLGKIYLFDKCLNRENKISTNESF